jgi:hypothetical protein
MNGGWWLQFHSRRKSENLYSIFPGSPKKVAGVRSVARPDVSQAFFSHASNSCRARSGSFTCALSPVAAIPQRADQAAARLGEPVIGCEALIMFYAGHDSAAKRAADPLAPDLGFEARDAGPLANGRFLEMLGRPIGCGLLRR